MNTPTITNPTFIPDSPTVDDLLEGKSHERIAEGLIKVIEKEDGGGVAYGIEGGWGSGKSTVMKKVESKLEGNKKAVVFLYDAWAHYGDCVKRSFQEALLQFLSKHNNYQTKPKQENLKNLVEQHETLIYKKDLIETATQKRLPSNVLGFIGLSIIMSVITSFISPALFKYITTEGVEGWISVTGYVVLSIPIIIAILLVIEGISPGRTKIKFISKLIFWKDNLTVNLLTEKPLRGQIEFNHQFLEIVKVIDQKFVIIIDNLDRLPEDAIRETWAIMRNFFSVEQNKDNQDILDNVYLLVPFDREYMTSVFANSNTTTPHTGQENAKKSKQPQAQKVHIENDRAVHGFLEKTFQAVFRIPPPILSDRVNFFQQLFELCFGESDLAYSIFQRFEHHYNSRQQTITPRLIKTFLNNLVAQVLINAPNIPLEDHALFLLYKYKLKELSNDSLEKLLKVETLAAYTELSWKNSFSALFYNVTLQHGLQILLGLDLKDALNRGDEELFNKLKKEHGFESAFVSLVSEWSIKKDYTDIEQFGYLNYFISIFDFTDPQQKKSILSSALQFHIIPPKIGTKLDRTIQLGLIYAIQDVNGITYDSIAKKIIEAISAIEKPPTKLDEKAHQFYLTYSYASAQLIDQIACKLKSIDPSHDLEFFKHISLTTAHYGCIGILAGSKNSIHLNNIWNQIKIFGGPQDIELHCLQLANITASFPSTRIFDPILFNSAKEAINNNSQRFPKKQFFQQVKQLCQSPTEKTAHNFMWLLELQNQQEGLCIDEQQIWNYYDLSQKWTDEYRAKYIWLLMELYLANPTINPSIAQNAQIFHLQISAYNQLRKFPNKIQKTLPLISAEIHKRGSLAKLLSHATPQHPQANLFKAVFKEFIQSYELGELSANEYFNLVANYSNLSKDWKQEVKGTLISKLLEYNYLLEEASKITKQNYSAFVDFLTEALRGKFEKGYELAKQIIVNLKEQDSSYWMICRQQPDRLKILIVFLEHKLPLNFGEPFLALFQGVFYLQGSGHQPWHLLPSCLDQIHKKLYRQELEDYFINESVKLSTRVKIFQNFTPENPDLWGLQSILKGVPGASNLEDFCSKFIIPSLQHSKLLTNNQRQIFEDRVKKLPASAIKQEALELLK